MTFSVSSAELNIPPYPLQTTGFVPPNVMFLFDTSGSMGYDLGDKTKLQIAKEVAIDIVDKTSDVRFCLARFNNNDGGRIVTPCAIPPTDPDDGIIDDINDLGADDWTPLAEAYYEVVNYFHDGSSIYNTDTDGRVSPIQYRCQKNFAIVLTDGVPYFDTNFPGLDAKVPGRTVVYGDYDGAENDGDLDNDDYWQRYRFLDDIAKLAYDSDLRDSGTDEAGKSFNDSLFSKQNLSTYTVGFALDDDDALAMLQEAAEKDGYGHGKYFNAQSADDLKNSFSNALTQITKTSQSVAASSANSGELSAGSMLYQSRYIASVWEGEVLALPISPESLSVSSTPAWRASSLLQTKGYSNRHIFTGHTADADHDGSVFKKAAFTSDQKNEYFGLDDIDFSNSRNMIQYIKGRAFDTHFRERGSILGDIVNSKPIYVGKPSSQSKFLSTGTTSDASLITSYASFVEGQASRKNMIYVGANDGMLHAFNADNGNEQYAYIPTLVIPQLKQLAKKDYQHRFYVDGTASVENVYFDGQWRSILAGGLGRGGKGLYALDVTETDPEKNDTAGKVLHQWEFEHADLGYSYSRPQIMRLNDGNFYVVLGNGYNSDSTDGDAVLFLLNIQTGAVTKRISTQVGRHENPSSATADNSLASANGLSDVTGYDQNNDGRVDFVYAGDLFGNLWKFDLSSSFPVQWGQSTPLKLFTACAADTCTTVAEDDSNNHQPITVKVEVKQLDSGSLMVYFGTGKLLETKDLDVAQIALQSFYGIRDTNTSVTSRSQLLGQHITNQTTISFGAESASIRITSNNSLGSELGWYMDLKKPSYSSDSTEPSYTLEGEQVLAPSIIRGDNIFFVTSAPNTADPCLPSSTNFLMQLNAKSGSRLNDVTIDLNGDGVVDDDDGYQESDGSVVAASGFAVRGGQTPTFVKIPGTDGKESNQELIIINHDNVNEQAGSGFAKGYLYDKGGDVVPGKRLSWRQIRSD